jgi:hypothetical protein
VVRKANRKSSRKRRPSRPHEYSDEERAAAFARAVADGDLPDPAVLTPEQLKEREESQKARKCLDAFLAAPQRVTVVSSPASGKQQKERTNRTYEKIRRIAASKWPNGYSDIRNRDLIKVIGDATGEKPDVILRALNRRQG